eukprot:1401519-Pyramimonas_sp.AAC.2
MRGRLGPGLSNRTSVRIFNRLVEWARDGLWNRADQRRAGILAQELGLGRHEVQWAVLSEKLAREKGVEEPLSTREVTIFHAVVTRASCLAQGRSDRRRSVKELARSMSAPARASWEGLAQVAEYLDEVHCGSSDRCPYQDRLDELIRWAVLQEGAQVNKWRCCHVGLSFFLKPRVST